MRATVALTQLVDTREAGGYTLPEQLLDAVTIARHLSGTTQPDVARPDLDEAAAPLVRAADAGDQLDLIAAGKRMHAQQQKWEAAQLGWSALRRAVEQAEERVSILTQDLADVIVTEHLRRAFDEVMTLAREHAKVLDGVALDDTLAVLAAPAAVRDAYRILVELNQRRTTLLNARRWANQAGLRKPQQDATDEFALLERPRALFPGIADTSPTPRDWDIPTDKARRMIWWATTAQVAGPWLPTTAEQEDAYDATYGEGNRMRAHAAHNARGYGAMTAGDVNLDGLR